VDKILIIAEVGSNWHTLDDCLASISVAKSVGADVVKFQLFTAEALFGYVPESWDKKRELPKEWLPILKARADEVGIEFACTAFSPELVAVVDPYVKRHKVSSSDTSWVALLDAVRATGKPVLLSVGGATLEEISMAQDRFEDVTLMYCEASYPARYHDLRKINVLADLFQCPIGFSDHTLDVIHAPLEARNRGAVVIEKHFTAFPSLQTADRGHSLGPIEFRDMVSVLRGGWPCEIGPSPGEADMREYHKRGPDGFRRLKP
jgi:N-acetylneuraminate synthase